RHVYSIASNAHQDSTDISRMNPADSLFGWVGNGPNQAIMGRLVFEFAKFENPELSWYKVPYPYGEWHHDGSKWQQKTGSKASMLVIANNWRLFPHAPLAPVIEQIDSFKPDGVQAKYFRAMLPGSKARFTIRFWNLEMSELQRLIWCLELEQGLAHKMGNSRYLGFGSLKFSILPESYLIDWAQRYAGKSLNNWHIPVDVDLKTAQKTIENYSALKKALNAEHL
ncbi:MAG: hypothetical protein HQK67_09070, partial [Desulfamplus sp.]|nr:hypothetical protein [Desulfamplus sp.]